MLYCIAEDLLIVKPWQVVVNEGEGMFTFNSNYVTVSQAGRYLLYLQIGSQVSDGGVECQTQPRVVWPRYLSSVHSKNHRVLKLEMTSEVWQVHVT